MTGQVEGWGAPVALHADGPDCGSIACYWHGADRRAVVSMAAVNAQAVTDEQLVEWTRHELAGVRNVATLEIRRRQYRFANVEDGVR